MNLKGKDAAPVTVYDVVVNIDLRQGKSWESKSIGDCTETDTLHAWENVSPIKNNSGG